MDVVSEVVSDTPVLVQVVVLNLPDEAQSVAGGDASAKRSERCTATFHQNRQGCVIHEVRQEDLLELLLKEASRNENHTTVAFGAELFKENGKLFEVWVSLMERGSVMNSVYGIWPMRGSATVTR